MEPGEGASRENDCTAIGGWEGENRRAAGVGETEAFQHSDYQRYGHGRQ
jgi:hypothetical protein